MEEEVELHVAKLNPKDPRSKYKYNIFCRLFLCWLDPLFWLGIRKPLEQSDLYVHPDESNSEKLLCRFNRYWSRELEKKRNGGKAYLSIVIFKCLWWRIILQGVIFFTETALLVYQSILLGYLTEYFSLSKQSSNDTVNAYLYATGMVAISLGLALLHAHTYLLAQKLGILARITITGAIYQKTLQINHTDLSRITTGHVINLASNDVQRFETGFIFIHSLWLNVMMVAVVTWLNYRKIGPSALLITLCALVLIPLQLLLARVYTKLRFGSALLTDRRVKIMNEVISGMRVIKMYAWEHAFKRVVDKLRKQEITKVFHAALIRAFNFGVYSVAVETMLLLAFSVYASEGGVVTPGRVFTVLVLTFYMRLISLLFFTGAVHSVAELWVAVVRIQKFLELGDKEDGTENRFNFLTRDEQGPEEAVKDPYMLQDHDQHNDAMVLFEHMAASWNLDKNKLSLNDINFEVTLSAPLLAVIGPVGSGKSTLLQCLLGELKPMEGTVVLKGKISYASQDPWVFSGTVRDNILFGSHFDESWYHTVVEACALSKDIKQLPQGDFTFVGERGVTLSGGQKSRVNLARAVYHRAQVYLLDDPLSAVDTVVARHIFDKCIQGLLRSSIVILVTHQIQFAMQADKILAMKDGAIEAYETTRDMLAKGIDTSTLVGKTGDEESLQCIGEEDEEDDNKDTPPAVLVPFEAKIPHAPSMISLAAYETSEPVAQVPVQAEDSAQGSISTMTYIQYFRAGAAIPLLLFTAAIFIIGEAAIVFSNWWLSDWASCASQNITVNITMATSTCTFDVQQRIGVLAGLTITAMILSFIRIFLIFGILINGGRVLHNRMFSSIMRVPVRFFDTNPSGRILNRFSKDIGFMDDLLTYLYAEFLILILRFLAIIITTAVANPWMLIAITIIIVCFLFLRKYFITTSRAIKRLEAIARSPVYSHISMTIQGLSTIRAFGKQNISTQHYHQYMNSHSQAAYLYLATNRWFGIRIDLLSAVLFACVAYASVPLTSSFSPSLLALGVTYTCTLAGMFQYCVRLSAEVENTMVSAERVMQYSSLEPEASLETLPPNEKPSPDWPQKGEIILDDVSFRYSKDTPLVLKSLSLIINPAEKVGIVGRTGAGKSSLIALLFRLAEPFGKLVIDGVQITSIGLHDLRSKMSIIPQDPILFSGSVRYNLDPFDEHQDQQLWDVLEQVQLKATIESLERGLESEISEGGSNFSVGQRQLVCLARALLRKNKILILDEATANVDLKTDSIIQSAIRESFCDCTVLTIAHRLNTVMDCDKIIVMDAGEIRESGEPHSLLQDPNSLLKEMVSNTGPSASRKLYQIARRRKHSIL